MKKTLQPLLFRVVNALGLITMFGLICTGLILKFVLPPGSGRFERLHSRGYGSGRPVMVWLGQSRHEWGDWHFYLSIAFLFLMTAHIILNWHWIRATAWGTPQCPQPWRRKLITIIIIFFILFALAIPFMIKAQAVI